MKRVVKSFIKKVPLILFFIVNTINIVFAGVPDEAKVVSVATDGVNLFFGALGGIGIIAGGFEFITAFYANKESEAQGGSGEASAKVASKIKAGIFCIIGAVVSFIILGYTLTLFDLG